MTQILETIQDHFASHDIARSILYGVGVAVSALSILFIFGPL